MAKKNDPIETNTVELQAEPVARDKDLAPNSSLMNKLSPLIAFAALLMTGYNYFSHTQLDQELTKKNQLLTSELQEVKQQQNNVEQQMVENANILKEAHRSIDERLSNFSKQAQNIINQKNNQNQDWLLLKARYYIELAQINAHWSTNFKEQSTISLLQQADTILSQMNDPELFKSRQTIAKEILQLKTVGQLDVPGLLSQLDAIQNSVSKLNIQTPPPNNTPLTKQHESSLTTGSRWNTGLQESIKILNKLVVVRRDNEDIKPLSSPLFASILKESIRLNLQEAQWAILNNNSMAYQFALTQAVLTLKKGFNEHLSNKTALLNQLRELQKINLPQESPSVGEALPLINQLIEQKQAKPADKAKEQKEQTL